MSGKLRNMTSIYVYDNNERLLLLYRIGSKIIRNSYIGTAGGHFEENELNDSKKCILRELEEETGLNSKDLEDLRLRYITLRNKNGEIRQNYYFFAKLKDENKKIESKEGKLNWFEFEETKKLDMPHTAKYVVEHYIETGRFDDKIYSGNAIESGIDFIELKEF